MSTSNEAAGNGLEIAIIGMAGAFPGAADLEQFWARLVAGEASISLLGDDELRAAGVHPGLLAQPNFVRAKGVFPDIDCFDADFFGYTPRDAAVMDPQVRALHQGVWHALEDAGYAAAPHGASAGPNAGPSIGLFAGASGNLAWELSTLLDAKEGSAAQFATIQLNDKDFAATRIAYKLNLRGPCVMLHCACSTSLYAVDLACRHLLTGACQIAVAAGTGLTLPHRNGYLYEDGMIKSADGACRPFSADANGTVEGNGMGAVVLKPLEAALRDRDRVYAVIRGSAANNDGARKVGYSAPSVDGQAEAIRRALHMAEVEPRSVSYVEAHGTGTALGDPVEIEGLKKAFRSADTGFCGIGSLKSNIGHLDTAAGISSLIKTVLALDRGVIPPSLNFDRANPEIDFDASPFRVVTAATPWPRDASAAPRRAGVSSFGIGGTNVHVILEEAPLLPPSGAGREAKLLCLSAHDAGALQRVRAALADAVDARPELPLADLAYTTQAGRAALKSRAAIAFRGRDDLLAQLRDDTAARGVDGVAATAARVGFLFPGQGSQYAGMAAGLHAHEAVFRDEVERLLAVCEREGLTELRGLLLAEPQPAQADLDAQAAIQRTELTQPALFIVELALARLLIDWGLQPAAMLGHSLGEYVCACIAGVLTPDDTMRLVIARGRLMASAPAGAMLAVAAAEDTVTGLLIDGVDLAAVNGPSNCTVAGPFARIDAFEEVLRAAGIKGRRLRTSHAFHSSMMDTVLDDFRAVLRGIAFAPPRLPYLSNLSGDWITAAQATDPEYWVAHLRGTVRFAAGAARALADGGTVFAELGPGSGLASLLKQNAAGAPVAAVPLLRGAGDPAAEHESVTRALGELWAHGAAPDWKRYNRGQLRSKVSLPPYPFERRFFPLGRGDIYTLLEHTGATAPRAGSALAADATLAVPGWQAALLPPAQPAGTLQPCLVFGDGAKAALRRVDGLRPIAVRPGRRFAARGAAGYRVDSARVSDHRRLLHALRAGDGVPGLSLWLPDGDGATMAALEPRLLPWLLALHDECRGQPMRCLVFVPKPAGDDRDVDGWVRGVRASSPALQLRVVCLDAGADAAAQADCIACEIGDDAVDAALVRWHGARREVYQPLALADAAVAPAAASWSGQRIGVLAPAGFPLHELARNIERASGASVLPMTWQHGRARGIASTLRSDLQALGDALQRSERRQLRRHGLGDQQRAHALMDELCSALVARYIHPSLALLPGVVFDRATLKARLGVVDALDRYVDCFIAMLRADGVLAVDGDSGDLVVCRGVASLREPGAIKHELLAASPLFGGQVQLLEHCVASYGRALTGERPANEVLYPEGRSDLLKRTGEDGIQQREDDYIRTLFEQLVRRLAAEARGQRLRILECGGGSGVMLRRLLPLLKGFAVDYHFSDVDPSLVADAREFALQAGHDHLSFGSFDISRDPDEQGLEPQSFDLVFAFDVVHATRHLGRSIGHLQRVLKHGGLLCLLERTGPRRHVDLIQGLADGWWQFDPSERSQSPLLDIDRWAALLRDAGMADVLAYPQSPELRAQLGVGLLVAQTRVAAGHFADGETSLPPWRFPRLDAGERLDGVVIVDCAPALPAAPFQALGAAAALKPRVDFDGWAQGVAAWVGAEQPGFVSVWSSGAAAAHPVDAAARARALARLDKRGAAALAAPRRWSRLSLPFDAATAPDEACVRDALRAVTGRLHGAIVQAQRQPLFARRGAGAEPAAAEAKPLDALAGDAGVERYVGLLHGIWSELLGIPVIGPDDDFFALGGDSLKVAQMTTELEKRGIKLLSNEVFNQPTLAALARYLREHRQQAEARVVHAEGLVAHFRDTLGVAAAAQTCMLGGQVYELLFVDDAALAGHDGGGGTVDVEGVLRGLNLPLRIEPHFVLPLSRRTREDASLRLRDEPAEAAFDAMWRHVREQQRRMVGAVRGAPAQAHYPLSPFQKMYMKGAARFSFYLIDFDEPLRLDLLNRAFTDIVAAQGLLRSTVQRRLGRPQWAEHAAPAALELPLADLSGYAPALQKQWLQQAMDREFACEIDPASELMYRAVLLRFDRRRHTLLFNLDHSIFDNMSGQVLRRQLLNRYHALAAGDSAPLPPVRSFRAYLEQLARGPQGITAERLSQLFELPGYEQAKLAVEQRIVARRQPVQSRLRYELELSRYAVSDDEQATWELSLVLLSCVLGRFLEQKAVPLKLIYQGRQYQDQSYFDTLGLFVDVVPLLVSVDRDDPAAMLDGIRDKLRTLNRYNVSFMGLLLDLGMRFRWWDVLGPVSPKRLAQRDPMILLNYVGKAEAEYQRVIDFATAKLADGTQKMDYASFYTIGTVRDGKLVFDIFCGFERDMGVLQRLFDEEAERLLPRRQAAVPALAHAA